MPRLPKEKKRNAGKTGGGGGGGNKPGGGGYAKNPDDLLKMRGQLQVSVLGMNLEESQVGKHLKDSAELERRNSFSDEEEDIGQLIEDEEAAKAKKSFRRRSSSLHSDKPDGKTKQQNFTELELVEHAEELYLTNLKGVSYLQKLLLRLGIVKSIGESAGGARKKSQTTSPGLSGLISLGFAGDNLPRETHTIYTFLLNTRRPEFHQRRVPSNPTAHFPISEILTKGIHVKSLVKKRRFGAKPIKYLLQYHRRSSILNLIEQRNKRSFIDNHEPTTSSVLLWNVESVCPVETTHNLKFNTLMGKSVQEKYIHYSLSKRREIDAMMRSVIFIFKNNDPAPWILELPVQYDNEPFEDPDTNAKVFCHELVTFLDHVRGLGSVIRSKEGDSFSEIDALFDDDGEHGSAIDDDIVYDENDEEGTHRPGINRATSSRISWSKNIVEQTDKHTIFNQFQRTRSTIDVYDYANGEGEFNSAETTVKRVTIDDYDDVKMQEQMVFDEDAIGAYSTHALEPVTDDDGDATTLYDHEIGKINNNRLLVNCPAFKSIPKSLLACVVDAHGSSATEMCEFIFGKISGIVLEAFNPEASPINERTRQITVDPLQALTQVFSTLQNSITNEVKGSNTSGASVLVVLYLYGQVYTAHVGDCQAMVGKIDRDYGTRTCTRLTTPHTTDNPEEHARTEKEGAFISPPELQGINERSRLWKTPFGIGGITKTRAIGETELTGVGVISTPEVNVHGVSDDNTQNFIMIANAGLWEVLDPLEAARFMHKHIPKSRNASKSTVALVKHATELWKERDTKAEYHLRDAVTAGVIYLPGFDQRLYKMKEQVPDDSDGNFGCGIFSTGD